MENTSSPPKRSLSNRTISWQKRLFYYLVRIPINLFFMIFYGVRFYGRNNMPNEGGVVVISNHQSHFDPPLIAAGLRRRLNFLARKSLFRLKSFAWLIDMLDAIPLDIEGIGFEGIKESLKRLRNGEMLLVFPEGARTWNGEIAPFLQGSLILAQRSKATILPTALNGCYDAWPRVNKFPWLWGKIRVIYGKPIPYTEFKDLQEEELRQLLETRIAELFQTLKTKR
ncbi:MAG: 1-acyl-sn-glycerol-3-phosphate acyltransferase [Planctomycetaceae bacterium]|jgi:1-acyl-sn-glycerol-3-phosphate acyltransferase|nr:1-acyl-sn-glycerol-3-phosphate acyltransferase [Planctomycetaceae bacterium]